MERKQNVAEIQRLVRLRKGRVGYSRALTRFLVAKGVAQPIAEAIARDAADIAFQQNSTGDACGISGLQESLMKYIHTAGEISFPTRLALVGPTGVGKTTTLLKLADCYRKQGKQVALVALDGEKHGSRVLLERFTVDRGIDFYDSLSQAEGDLILIDTSGCNFYLPNRVDQLGEQLSGFGHIEIMLTLSASTKDVDLYGAIHQFSPLQPTSLVFTKLDETLANGVLINVSVRTDLPIRYITYGYPLPGEIQIADPHKITHKILTEFNQEEFNLLRHCLIS